jgi:hypothetical protein
MHAISQLATRGDTEDGSWIEFLSELLWGAAKEPVCGKY